MTNPDLTFIAALLDRSGSMESIKDDTAGGFDAFIAEQAKQGGRVEVTLAQFDTEFEYVYHQLPIGAVPPLRLEPRGGTALLDGVGRLVTDMGRVLAARPAAERPGLVVVVITTDGQENSSREWTVAKLRELITQQQDVYRWKFVFLGANIDAVQTGASYGIPMASSLTYAASSMGTRSAYAMASGLVTNMRDGGVGGFTDDDRAKAAQK